jgi:hypothetical protein
MPITTLEEFHDAYRQKHASDPLFCFGYSIKSYIPEISMLCNESNIKTAFDYGCGKASTHSHHNLRKLFGWDELFLYDPGLPEYSAKPQNKMFDLVLCIDVLEHVPEKYIDDTIDELLSYTNKMLFVAVSCRPASKRLPDGTNAHVTVNDPSWWREKFERADKYVKLKCVI